jgi:hypothetical protein
MSITTAKASQAAAKAKAQRLCGMGNTEKPFYPAGEKASDKTGMRPISKQGLKSGGKVIGGKITGPKAAARADRVARKSGGRIGKELANMDLKAANKARKGGDDHEGGLKRGGAAKPKKAFGGPSGRLSEQVGKNPVAEMQNVQQYEADKAQNAGGIAGMYAGAMRKSGGKVGKPSQKDKAWSKYKADAKEAGISEKDAEGSKSKFKPASKKTAMKDEKPFESRSLKTKPVEEKKKFAPVEEADVENMEATPDDEAQENDMPLKKGGRVKKWSGGGFSGEKKTKKKVSTGKKNVTNIIIAGNPNSTPAAGAGAAVPPIAPGPRAPAPVMPIGGNGPNPPPPGGDQPMPPMGALAANPMMPPQAGMPPDMPPRQMANKGGRIGSYAAMKAGSGSGLGRLKKAGIHSISK